MLSEYTMNIKRLEERVRAAENRAATAALHVRYLNIHRFV